MHTHQIMEQMQPLISRSPYYFLALAGTEVKAVSPNKQN
jgi:hypothetical protein